MITIMTYFGKLYKESQGMKKKLVLFYRTKFNKKKLLLTTPRINNNNKLNASSM